MLIFVVSLCLVTRCQAFRMEKGFARLIDRFGSVAPVGTLNPKP